MAEVKKESGRKLWRKNYNFAKSAALATALAVIFLGLSIFLFAQDQSKNVQIAGLREQVSNLTIDNHNAKQDYTVTYSGQNGQSAYALLVKNHVVKSKEYSGLGKFVTDIDGVKADGSHYWSFNVNGKLSEVGASQYTTKNGDKIEWKLAQY